MTRMTARQIAVQLLFSLDLNKLSVDEAIDLLFSDEHYQSLFDEDKLFQEDADQEQVKYIRNILMQVEIHLEEIDHVISKYSKAWKKERLSKTTLAILRCAIAEISYCDDIPNSAAINEAVELGKSYDSPQAGAFINGVLGTFIRESVTGTVADE